MRPFNCRHVAAGSSKIRCLTARRDGEKALKIAVGRPAPGISIILGEAGPDL